MPNTTNLGLPYPAATDAPDGAGAIFNLAGAVDITLGAPWTAFSPNFTNAGGLTATGEYVRVGRHLHFIGSATFGSAGTVGGLIGMSLPVTRRGNTLPTGRVLGVDTGNGLYELVPIFTGSSTVGLQYRPAGSASLSPTAAGAPFVWGNTDQILWDIWYAVD